MKRIIGICVVLMFMFSFALPYLPARAKDESVTAALPGQTLYNLTGKWSINANGYLGTFEVATQSGNVFSGTINIDAGSTEKLINGRIDGNTITFTRMWDGESLRQDYTGTLTVDGGGNARISGTFTQDYAGSYSWEASKAAPISVSAPAAPVPSAQPGTVMLEDAGCDFSDLIGQVEILHPTGYDENGVPQYDDEEAWEFAKIDTKLYTGTKIKTGLDSGAIISFADMSTFNEGANTTITLSSPTHKESKLKLAIGNIWVNIKKMMEGGSMEVEMSQAVAGARGTTFILEETGSSSTVKVIEGTVFFKTKAGNTAEITAGNMATSDSFGTIQRATFEISQESNRWEKTVIELQINNKNMKINGELKEIDPGRDTVPMIYNDRTLIPIRAVFEAMGGTVGYDDKEQKITLKIGDKTLEMWVDKSALKLNGNSKTMDVSPMVINDRTMVPVRFVAENFGYEVQWKENEQRIIIQ